MWIDFYIVIGPIISYTCVITPLVLQIVTNSEVRLYFYTDLRLWRGFTTQITAAKIYLKVLERCTYVWFDRLQDAMIHRRATGVSAIDTIEFRYALYVHAYLVHYSPLTIYLTIRLCARDFCRAL